MDQGSMGQDKESLSYRDAGVDIDAGNEVVRRIQESVRSTYSPNVLELSHGSFGGFYALTDALQEPVLVGATDGVGTKLKLAFSSGRYDTVGIDLVAMCVNDLIVGGARPLFFLDYVGTGELEPSAIASVVEGIAEGCRQSSCALLGGETAELPGFYQRGEFDLAGFAVGIVDRPKIIDGQRVQVGDKVLGLASNGVHSNGFSLVRRALTEGRSKEELEATHPELGHSLFDELLTPTRIYVPSIMQLCERHHDSLHALAHITGGGLVENIPRVLPGGCSVQLDRSAWSVPKIFELVQRAGNVAPEEMDRVFNQGLGMVVVVDAAQVDSMLATLRESGEDARVVGEVVAGDGEVLFN